MVPLSHKKKDRGISKSCFALIDQSVTLNFELNYNERTLVRHQILDQKSVHLRKLQYKSYKCLDQTLLKNLSFNFPYL